MIYGPKLMVLKQMELFPFVQAPGWPFFGSNFFGFPSFKRPWPFSGGTHPPGTPPPRTPGTPVSIRCLLQGLDLGSFDRNVGVDIIRQAMQAKPGNGKTACEMSVAQRFFFFLFFSLRIA